MVFVVIVVVDVLAYGSRGCASVAGNVRMSCGPYWCSGLGCRPSTIENSSRRTVVHRTVADALQEHIICEVGPVVVCVLLFVVAQ